MDRKKKFVSQYAEESSYEVIPYEYKQHYLSKDNLIYGSTMHFYQGENERESCREMNNVYVGRIPRILILPNWSSWDADKLANSLEAFN